MFDNYYPTRIIIKIMAETEKSIPLAISLPESLITEIDGLAADLKESRSSIMRRAIREGMAFVKAGRNADVITLDSEFSAEVDQLSAEIGLRRNKILLEAIRTGMQAFAARTLSEKMTLAQEQDPEKRERLIQALEESYKLYDDPMTIEHRRLIMERGNATTRLLDILQQVPEAKRRSDLVNRLTELRAQPDGPSGGPAWGRGLSTDEIEYQVKMFETFGAQPANWPAEIKKLHSDWQDKMGQKYGFDHFQWPPSEIKAHYSAVETKVKSISPIPAKSKSPRK